MMLQVARAASTKRGRIEWMDRVEVDHPSADAESDTDFVGGERVVDGGAGADQRRVIVR